MTYKINFNEYKNNFSVPQGVVNDDNYKNVKSEYIKVILYILKNSAKIFSVEYLSTVLNLSETEIEEALNYYSSLNILMVNEKNDVKKEKVHIVKNNSIKQDFAIEDNQELKYLIECMEQQLKRPVTPSEYKKVIEILNNLGLPADVVLMAVAHCISINKMNINYLEKLCTAWSEKGINTHEIATKQLEKLAESKSYISNVKRIIGVDRKLIEDEEIMINRWYNEYNFSLECIELAYEKTVKAITNFSLPYMNSILTNWYNAGLKTINDIKENDEHKRGRYNKKRVENKTYDIDEIDKFWDTVPTLSNEEK